MGEHSVSDFSHLLQVQAQERVVACLYRLEALMAVATRTDGFYDLPGRILHNYFSVASDLIEQVAEVNQMGLSELPKRGR